MSKSRISREATMDVLPKDDAGAVLAYVDGLATAATNRPLAFNLQGEFTELDRLDAQDRFQAPNTLTYGYYDEDGKLVAAALMSVHAEYVDIEDVYNNGAKGAGALVMEAALRHAAAMREHVLIGVLRGNAAMAEVYKRIGFEPYVEASDVLYLHLGGVERIQLAAEMLAQHQWKLSEQATQAILAAGLSNTHQLPPMRWLRGEVQGF